MAKGSDIHTTPFEVDPSLVAFGAHLARTRLARGDTQGLAAERCGLHVKTVARIERGDPAVAVGKIFTLLHMYGQTERIFELSNTDPATEILYRHHLPKRGRSSSLAPPGDHAPSPGPGIEAGAFERRRNFSFKDG